MRSSNFYQILLIFSGLLVTALFGAFLYREIFPEYKIYQKDYVNLEDFRSSYTQEPPPAFSIGIKQIVIEREDNGPPVIDRCTSCHVALQIPDFSPTKVAHDINGAVQRDQNDQPILVANEQYIWKKLDQKIVELRDEAVNQQLRQEGKEAEIKERLKQADVYEALKTAKVGDHIYDVTKVLAMHPLMGKETRPFEYHPIDEYGCTSCHNGNGRGLTTEKAHGPVFDGQYEKEFRGFIPQFTESDPLNDPQFSREFNAKPSDQLLFQTTPIFVGHLIQSKCMQCHQTSQTQMEQAAFSNSYVLEKKEKQIEAIKKAFEEDKRALLSLLKIKQLLIDKGYQHTLVILKKQQSDYTQSLQNQNDLASQLKFLSSLQAYSQTDDSVITKKALEKINEQMKSLIGSNDLMQRLQTIYAEKGPTIIDSFLTSHSDNADATGSLFVKQEKLNLDEALLRHIQETETSFNSAVKDQTVISALVTDVDELTKNYQRGKELYISQACYACHRIAGFARGGVGPELTKEGESYPWFIKESIVWPQADLKTSTMPNMRLDHIELEDLMTFLLAQKGSNRAIAQSAYQIAVQSWEAGRKLAWEKPVPPAQMYDLQYGMTVFATEGCASCHRLQGFKSNVGFAIEKEQPNFDQVNEQQEWFKKLFPEVIRISQYDQPLPGSQIVSQIEKNQEEIDKRIIANVRMDSILEEIEKKYPQTIESLYAEFRYAERAKNHYYENLIKQTHDPKTVTQLKAEQQAWKERVHRVLMMFIQTYGLGRLIGPHLNWSGIYRTDEWLMEHFRNPSAHVPRSLMPVFPFDETKFYALTLMLDRLGVLNRQATRAIWTHKGFDPAEAYQLHCAQCHGIDLLGNGPISEWIYPIPKSLRNSDFMRNLTKERAIDSITHGVKGTPMPPWGEIAKDKPTAIQEEMNQQPILTNNEIQHLVNWLFTGLPGGEIIKSSADVLKWQYTPQDVLEELQREGGQLHPLPANQTQERDQKQSLPERELPEENNPPVESEVSHLDFNSALQETYYVAIRPEIYPKQAPKGIQQVNQVEDVFDLVQNPPEYPDATSYYIKQNYYTPYNLEQGQKFFLLNCAVCHGNEGDGSGIRGQAMQEAKPRMLTNLDWINSRDDLRLLRSIKYGVQGTSMTPWGDFTNSLQRMQLVMFIRTLSKEQGRRQSLDSALYRNFDESSFTIDRARIELSQKLEQAKQQRKDLEQKQKDLEYLVEQNKIPSDKPLNNYQTLLKLDQQIKELENQNALLTQLKTLVRKERDLYQSTGISLITQKADDSVLENYQKMMELNSERYQVKEEHLYIKDESQTIQHIRLFRQMIVDQLNQKKENFENSLSIKDKKDAAEKSEDIKTTESSIVAYQKLEAELISNIEEIIRLILQQKQVVSQLNENQGEAQSNQQQSKKEIENGHIRR